MPENNGRWYNIKGKKLPSVTTILAETSDNTWLNDWKSRTPNWDTISRRAAIIGTIAHYRILSKYAISRMEPPNIPTLDWPTDIKLVMDRLTEAENMLEKLGIDRSKPIYVEHLVTRFKYPSYAGTLDLLAMINSKRTVLDLKTSKKLRDDYVLQIGGYSRALRAKGIQCEQGILVRCNPETGSELMIIEKPELTEAEHKFIDRAIAFWEKYKCQTTNSTSRSILSF